MTDISEKQFLKAFSITSFHVEFSNSYLAISSVLNCFFWSRKLIFLRVFEFSHKGDITIVIKKKKKKERKEKKGRKRKKMKEGTSSEIYLHRIRNFSSCARSFISNFVKRCHSFDVIVHIGLYLPMMLPFFKHAIYHRRRIDRYLISTLISYGKTV